MSDFHESPGQDVLQVAPNELEHIKRTVSGSTRTDLIVLECDRLAVVLGNPGIGYTDPEDVSTQISERALTISN